MPPKSNAALASNVRPGRKHRSSSGAKSFGYVPGQAGNLMPALRASFIRSNRSGAFSIIRSPGWNEVKSRISLPRIALRSIRATFRPYGPHQGRQFGQRRDLAIGRARQALARLAVAIAPYGLHTEGRSRVGVPGI